MFISEVTIPTPTTAPGTAEMRDAGTITCVIVVMDDGSVYFDGAGGNTSEAEAEAESVPYDIVVLADVLGVPVKVGDVEMLTTSVPVDVLAMDSVFGLSLMDGLPLMDSVCVRDTDGSLDSVRTAVFETVRIVDLEPVVGKEREAVPELLSVHPSTCSRR